MNVQSVPLSTLAVWICSAYLVPPPAVWMCRVYLFPPPAVLMCSVYLFPPSAMMCRVYPFPCTTSSIDLQGYSFPPPAVWTCRVYPGPSLAVWHAGCMYAFSPELLLTHGPVSYGAGSPAALHLPSLTQSARWNWRPLLLPAACPAASSMSRTPAWRSPPPPACSLGSPPKLHQLAFVRAPAGWPWPISIAPSPVPTSLPATGPGVLGTTSP